MLIRTGVHNVDAAEEDRADGVEGGPGSEEDDEEYDSGGSGVALTPPDSPSPLDAAAAAAAGSSTKGKSQSYFVNRRGSSVLSIPFDHRVSLTIRLVVTK